MPIKNCKKNANGYATLMAIMLMISGCGGGSAHNQWDDIDYSRVRSSGQSRENDPGYTAPTVLGCADDDLYNCNK